MASFGWKRKVGEKVSKSVVEKFEAEEDRAAPRPRGEEVVDWLHAVKRRREALLEDCETRSGRLKDEGVALAEQGRHWEALKKWDEAIQMTPDNPILYEMKSQVLTILQEVFPAVKAAEMAVKFRPLWWEGWQTLGRAQLNLGEVDLAVRSFQVAIHLCPSERPLWQEDLQWACRLQKQQSATKEKMRQEEETKSQIDHAPELNHDYEDFESDEVLAACVAVAERQTRYEELRRTAVVVDAEGNVQNIVTEEGSQDAATPSTEQFVKARGL